MRAVQVKWQQLGADSPASDKVQIAHFKEDFNLFSYFANAIHGQWIAQYCLLLFNDSIFLRVMVLM